MKMRSVNACTHEPDLGVRLLFQSRRLAAGDAVVAGSRPTLNRFDVYQNSSAGRKLLATTARAHLDCHHSATPEIERRHNREPGSVRLRLRANNSDYWLIRADIASPQHSGFIEALVLKSPHLQLLRTCIVNTTWCCSGAFWLRFGLLYLLFSYFFRRPLKTSCSDDRNPRRITAGSRSSAA